MVVPGTFAVRPAAADDLGAVLGVQQRAFSRVAESLAIDPSRLPPLTESLADLEALFAGGVSFFVACDSTGAVVGAVRSVVCGSTVEIGRLVVEAGWERRGVASCLMDLLESAHRGAERFELFTGADAAAPLALYEGRGYRRFRSETAGGVELVWLEKQGRPALP